MGEEGSWPPKSAFEAMMSSPNGRKGTANIRLGSIQSPIKDGRGTPSFLDQLRMARNGAGQREATKEQVAENDEQDEQEDEEILQLELAAIEARLKLKRLQKEKRNGETPSSHRTVPASNPLSLTADRVSQIEVPLSPSRRIQIPVEPKSPNRVLLGIDKGRKAADISLRSTRATLGSPTKERRSRQAIYGSNAIKSRTTSGRGGNAEALSAIKSFSERMGQFRESDKEQSVRRAAAAASRSRDLGIDLMEVENYQKVSKHSQSEGERQEPSISLNRGPMSAKETIYTRDEVISGRNLNTNQPDDLASSQGDPSLFEGFSNLHLSSRILPDSFLKRTFPTNRFTIYTVPDLLKVIYSPLYELPEEVSNFVVFGIIASMSKPLDQKKKAAERTKTSDASNMNWDDGSMNEKKFMAITITDLQWTVDMYLFDTAVPRYHRLSVGTVVAIVNPNIMRPKRGREDTGVFSLSLHNSEEVVLEIGQARDLGHCKALKKDQQECGSWIDASKTSICEFHLNMEVAKTQAGRMGVNAGSNGFGSGETLRWNKKSKTGKGETGLLPAPGKKTYDWESQSYYYIAASSVKKGHATGAPKPRAGMSTARMLDLNVDNPFIAEGQIVRNSEAQLQKHMARQEKEREIARQLSKSRSKTNAGAEYMRKRLASNFTSNAQNQIGGADNAITTMDPTSTQSGPTSTQSSSTKIDLRAQIGRKRSAQDIQLSPVRKKTRFLTSTGIKETGRESLGSGSSTTARGTLISNEATRNRGANDNNDDDDSDDLDII